MINPGACAKLRHRLRIDMVMMQDIIGRMEDAVDELQAEDFDCVYFVGQLCKLVERAAICKDRMGDFVREYCPDKAKP